MMRVQQIRGILVLLGIIVSAILYNAVTTTQQQQTDPQLQHAYIRYQTEHVELKRQTLKRNDLLKFYGIIMLLGTINLCLLILAGGYARAKVKAASVHTAHIGEHSTIPVHTKDFHQLYPIAANLSLAEIEASLSTSHDTAYTISRQMMEDMTNYTRAITGKHSILPLTNEHVSLNQTPIPLQASTPTFAELLSNGILAPGKPLVLGYYQGQPQYRSLQDLKSVAIAGWQGSGKTLSTAYLIASGVLAYGVYVYIIDPHKHHNESLSSLIKPLEATGFVTSINPFDTPNLLKDLNRVLDRRLSGKEPSHPGILLVIDEFARLAKMECFDGLVAFLERCTEETRKANMTFLGSSSKWTARYFKGRADIRGCMNSMLIHKTKPSQADLLLEDARNKHLVRQLHHPGEAVLVTDYDFPTLVSIPFCTRKDMETVANIVTQKRGHNAPTMSSQTISDTTKTNTIDKDSTTTSTLNDERFQSPLNHVIFLEKLRNKYANAQKKACSPDQLTVETIQEHISTLKHQNPKLTQTAIARQAGLSPSLLSKIINGRSPLKDEYKRKLYDVLFRAEAEKVPAVIG